METSQTYALAYKGRGSELFKIQIVNLILTTVTFGLYYPWAKARSLEYLYGQSHFEESPFAFTGSGKEMFKGFIKAFLFLIGIAGIAVVLFTLSEMPQLGLLWFYVAIFAITPLALHGTYKYRMAKTTWRGIRFGYTGSRGELVKLFFKGLLLTVLTFGIYGAWFAIHLRRYIIGHIKIGNASFNYHGKGRDYFFMNLAGYFLTLFTLGIYMFWWQRNIFRYFVDHTTLEQGDQKVHLQSKATAGGFFRLFIGNFFIFFFTLGLGFPWIMTRNLRFVSNNISFIGELSFDALQQEQQDYSNALGEDVSDFLDFGFVI